MIFFLTTPGFYAGRSINHHADGHLVDDFLVSCGAKKPQPIPQTIPPLVAGLLLVGVVPFPGSNLLVLLVLETRGPGVGQSDAEKEGGVNACADRALHDGQRPNLTSNIIDNHQEYKLQNWVRLHPAPSSRDLQK